jgi:ketosteroid isomerase-like protein
MNACVLVACMTTALANDTIAAPKDDEAEAIVRTLSDEEPAAFLRRDADALARMWSNDLVVTNPLNRLVTKQQVLDMVRSGFLVITSYSRRVEYAKRYGDIVILVGAEEVVWGGRMPNAGKSEKLRFTALWRNENGTWREVARHANIVHAASQ